MRKTYPSDITREQFENIRPMLEGIRKKTHPRTLDGPVAQCNIREESKESDGFLADSRISFLAFVSL